MIIVAIMYKYGVRIRWTLPVAIVRLRVAASNSLYIVYRLPEEARYF